MLQIQKLTPYFDAEWSPEHFDTFLNQSAKNQKVQVEKLYSWSGE